MFVERAYSRSPLVSVCLTDKDCLCVDMNDISSDARLSASVGGNAEQHSRGDKTLDSRYGILRASSTRKLTSGDRKQEKNTELPYK